MPQSQYHSEFIEALEEVYPSLERFVRALSWRFGWRISGRSEGGSTIEEEIIAETIAIAYEKHASLHHKQALQSYCFTIASRLYQRQYKLKQRMQTASQLVPAGSEPETFWEDLYAKEYAEHQHHSETSTDTTILYQALDTLPEKQREAIIMFEILGFSMKEIAHIQGRSEISVKVSISRGRKLLAKRLGAE